MPQQPEITNKTVGFAGPFINTLSLYMLNYKKNSPVASPY